VRNSLLTVTQLSLLLWGINFAEHSAGQENFRGQWQASLDSPGGAIEFGLEICSEKDAERANWSAFLINGTERIAVPEVALEGRQLRLGIDHYDSVLTLDPVSLTGEIAGHWRKRRSKAEWVEMRLQARKAFREFASPKDYLGRWSVQFAKSEDPAVAIFVQAPDSNRLHGTFLTTTGDYRYLDGYVDEAGLHLSCFDGAHAFLFRANLADGKRDKLTGEFWSANTWQESWTATRDANAKLPDAFETTTADSKQLHQLGFPDLAGNPRRLDDPLFAGRARIIYVFGSWCPNCHDAGNYFAELETRYADRGLAILGLAFELTGDFERDSAQVRKYQQRHGTKYPILVAGLADKEQASAALPLLDRVRSYPTTIFIDGQGQIRAVHTGFSGPATGVEHAELKKEFEFLIESMLESEK
jgi:thiol-disulfide isomerase/thioredoxin